MSPPPRRRAAAAHSDQPRSRGAKKSAESAPSAPPDDTAVAPPAVAPPVDVPTPAAADTIATLIPIEAHRPNLLDTGLSDYGMWVEIVDRMKPAPLPAGDRPGRIWT